MPVQTYNKVVATQASDCIQAFILTNIGLYFEAKAHQNCPTQKKRKIQRKIFFLLTHNKQKDSRQKAKHKSKVNLNFVNNSLGKNI